MGFSICSSDILLTISIQLAKQAPTMPTECKANSVAEIADPIHCFIEQRRKTAHTSTDHFNFKLYRIVFAWISSLQN